MFMIFNVMPSSNYAIISVCVIKTCPQIMLWILYIYMYKDRNLDIVYTFQSIISSEELRKVPRNT